MPADVTVWGKARTVRRPVVGAVKVARYFAGLQANFGTGIAITFGEINGSPAVLGWTGAELLGVVPQIRGDVITSFHVVVNPGKLGFIRRQAS